MFAWAFKAVITRCFGWFLPTNMIIPLADHLNHSAVDVHYELYHKYKHWEVTQDVYHTKEKMKQDFSDYDLVEGEMGNIVKPPRPMCKKIFVDDKMDSVHIGPDQDFDMQKLHKDQQIWNVYLYYIYIYIADFIPVLAQKMMTVKQMRKKNQDQKDQERRMHQKKRRSTF